MRILFVGCVFFSARALEKLFSLKGDIVGVVTKETSSFNADFVDLAPIARSAGVPSLSTPNINTGGCVEWCLDKRPDIVFCFGWSQLIKKDFLAVAPMGVVGFHPTALPKNRGRHPLIWTLVLGLTETASTFFFMDEGMDSGDILSQEKIVLDPSEDAASLYGKVTDTALGQIEKFLPELVLGMYQRHVQDRSLATTWRKRGLEDGKIDWRMSCHSIDRLIRGLTRPYAGAHFILEGNEIKVWKGRPCQKPETRHLEPGRVLETDLEANRLVVKCGEGALELLEHELSPLPIPGTYL